MKRVIHWLVTPVFWLLIGIGFVIGHIGEAIWIAGAWLHDITMPTPWDRNP